MPTRESGATTTRRTLGAITDSGTFIGELTLDFITCLPESDGYGTIIVVVDRLSKYANFMPAIAGCIARRLSSYFQKCDEVLGVAKTYQ